MVLFVFQDWVCWEELCARLALLLDQSEALLSAEEPGGDDEEEETLQRRLDACRVRPVTLINQIPDQSFINLTNHLAVSS